MCHGNEQSISDAVGQGLSLAGCQGRTEGTVGKRGAADCAMAHRVHARTAYGNSRHRHYIRRFFSERPQLNPDRLLIKGTVCGVRVEIIAEPLMREIRYLDKLVDELAKGKSMDKILRNSCPNT